MRTLFKTVSEGRGLPSFSVLDQLPKTYEDFVSKLGDKYPGFDDNEYMDWLHRTRSLSSSTSKTHQVEYSSLNNATWSKIFPILRSLHYTYACKEHTSTLSELESERIFTNDKIPQFSTVNKYLMHKTGFKLVNVGGMIHPRTFLYGLGMGIFYSTQYIRHHSVPFYSPEPDIIHELMGHVPLLANQKFAEFSKGIGKLAFEASDEEIDILAKVYFFTVEFGVANGKIVGAGILGSCNESEHVGMKKGKVVPWDWNRVLNEELVLSEYQPCYADIGSIDNLPDIFEELQQRVF